MNRCLHLLTHFLKLTHPNGVHVIERCRNCRVNVRGKAQWMPQFLVAKMRIDVATLGEDPWHGETAPGPNVHQLKLF